MNRDPEDRDDWVEDARRDELDEHDERFGIGSCRTGRCDEPCGENGGCSR